MGQENQVIDRKARSEINKASNVVGQDVCAACVAALRPIYLRRRNAGRIPVGDQEAHAEVLALELKKRLMKTIQDWFNEQV